MKAWIVRDNIEGYIVIVFAETRGKAKVIGLRELDDDDIYFTDLSAYRIPELDKYYEYSDHMNFYNPVHRRILVEHGMHCGWVCDDECKMCSANDICEIWQGWLKECQDAEQ